MKKATTVNNDLTVRGVVLLAVGAVALLSNFGRIEVFDNFGLYLLPVMGALFILSAFVKQQSGLLIPGGILSGIGVGIIAESNALGLAFFSDLPEGAGFLSAFAVGWLSIVVFSRLINDETQWWALIPAAIFSLIVASITFGGAFVTMLTLLGKAWPLILIGLGVKVILENTNN